MSVTCIEIVTVRPLDVDMSEEKLRALHSASGSDIQRLHPELQASYLLRGDEGQYVDVLLWESRDGAQRALDGAEMIDGFGAWASAIDVVSFQMLDVAS